MENNSTIAIIYLDVKVNLKLSIYCRISEYVMMFFFDFYVKPLKPEHIWFVSYFSIHLTFSRVSHINIGKALSGVCPMWMMTRILLQYH